MTSTLPMPLEMPFNMSFDEILRSQSLPIWAILIVSALATIILLVTLFQADRSRANGVLAVFTLLAVSVAAMLALRTLLPAGGPAGTSSRATSPGIIISGPEQLACLNELAGGHVETACENALFASPQDVAAAVTYVAAQLDQLGRPHASDTPARNATRRAIERDRYGFVAHVLMTRDGCTPASCAAFETLSDTARITSNMTARTYDGLVGRHMLAWNSGGGATPSATAVAPVSPSAQPANTPSGIPSTIDFPSAGSIPPISIMTETPSSPTAPERAENPQGAQPATPVPQPRPQVNTRRPAKPPASAGPVQLAPGR